MDLNTLPQIRLSDVNDHVRYVVEKVEPNLHDVRLFYQGKKFVEICLHLPKMQAQERRRSQFCKDG